jgi:IclR family acetate operon transcriptional repressor
MPTEGADDQEPTAALPGGTQTLVRGLHVLEAVAGRGEPIGVGELSKLVGLPKSTVQRLLRTLEQEGWAEVSGEPVTRWQLSPRLLALGRRATPARSLHDAARPHIEALAARTGETIHLAVPDQDRRIVLIERIDSVHPVRTFVSIGASMHLHTSASGKALLSLLPNDHVERILARPLERVMPNTTVDPQNLMHQVLEAREHGYAVNISENRAHVCAIGAAVADSSGRPVATVAISMPDLRFDPTRVGEWGGWVAETARAIGHDLGE